MGASETRRFPAKKALKGAIGEAPDFEETSLFGAEYTGDGQYMVVGPHPHERKWYATVTVANGRIARVS